jgi:hypothetical protein
MAVVSATLTLFPFAEFFAVTVCVHVLLKWFDYHLKKRRKIHSLALSPAKCRVKNDVADT